MNKATDAFRRVVDGKVGQPWRRLRATAIVLALLGRSLLAGENPTSSMRFSGEPPGVASASSQGSLNIRVRNAADSRAHGTDMQPQGTAAPFTSPEAAEMWYAGKRVDSGNREAGKSDEAARGTQQSTAPLPPDLGLNTDRPNSESPSPDGTKRDQFGLPPAPFSRALSHERLQQFHGAFRNAEAYEVETHRPETSPADGWFLEWPGYGPRRRSSTFPNPLRIRPLLNDSTGISDGASWLLAGRGLPGEDENAKFDPDFQDRFLANILLSGGGSQIRGLDHLLEEALAPYGPASVTKVYDYVFAGAVGALRLAMATPAEHWTQLQQRSASTTAAARKAA